MSAVLNFTGTLETLVCGECGVEFAMPVHMVNSRREDKKSFYCPNGHGRAFLQGKVDRLERELAAATARAKAESERAERHWKSFRQTDGKLKALKKRVQNGVCPCCKRTFQQLARHMATKHPTYAKQHPELVEEPKP